MCAVSRDSPLYSRDTDSPIYSKDTNLPSWGDPAKCPCCGLWTLTPCDEVCSPCEVVVPISYDVTISGASAMPGNLDQCYILHPEPFPSDYSTYTFRDTSSPKQSNAWAETLNGTYTLDWLEPCVWQTSPPKGVDKFYNVCQRQGLDCASYPCDGAWQLDPVYSGEGLYVRLEYYGTGWGVTAWWGDASARIIAFESEDYNGVGVEPDKGCLDSFNVPNYEFENEAYFTMRYYMGGSAAVSPNEEYGMCSGGAYICTEDDMSAYAGKVVRLDDGVAYLVSEGKYKSLYDCEIVNDLTVSYTYPGNCYAACVT